MTANEKSLRTREGALELVASIMNTMRENFQRDGYLTPVAFVIMTTDPRNNTTLEEPQVAVVFPSSMSDEDEKDGFREALGKIVQQSHAIGVLLGVEAWTASLDQKALSDEEKKNPEEAIKRKMRNRRPSEMPDRKEGLFVTFEHRAFGAKTMSWHAEITRNQKNEPSLGDFEGGEMDRAEGRFAQFLPVLS